MNIVYSRAGQSYEAAYSAARSAVDVTIVALVVTHNRLSHLRLTLARLLDEALDHVVVVDNASRDDTRAWLESQTDPRLRVIRLTQNGGGAAGFEHGLREVTRTLDPDWCVVLDDDARPEPGAIARFRAELAAGTMAGYDALAAAVFYPNGEICEMNRPSRNPFWHIPSLLRTALGGGRSGFHISDRAYGAESVLPVDAASFVGLFLSRTAIRKGGYPRGDLFIYGDDVLYTLDLTRRGGTIGFLPSVHFEHDCATFERGKRRVHRPLWKVYYNYRNGLWAYRAAAGPLLFWLVLIVVLPKWLMNSRHYGEDRAVYRRFLWLAVRDALAGTITRSHHEIRAREQQWLRLARSTKGSLRSAA